jgi:hypothetical protein
VLISVISGYVNCLQNKQEPWSCNLLSHSVVDCSCNDNVFV